MSSSRLPPSSSSASGGKAGEHPVQAADGQTSASGAAKIYLTRVEVAERYPISIHTLAKLASQHKGPRYYKPTDKCLYRPEDIEAWIEAAAVLPVMAEPARSPSGQRRQSITPPGGRGRAKSPPRATLTEASHRNGRKSLPPSANSWLRRSD